MTNRGIPLIARIVQITVILSCIVGSLWIGMRFLNLSRFLRVQKRNVPLCSTNLPIFPATLFLADYSNTARQKSKWARRGE